MNEIISKTDRVKIFDTIRRDIKEQGSGDVISALNSILGPDQDLEENAIKIANAITSDGKFVKLQRNANFWISENPEYRIIQFQRKFGNLSLILAGLSFIFIAISTIFQVTDRLPDEVKLLKETLQNQQKTLRNMDSSLMKISTFSLTSNSSKSTRQHKSDCERSN